MYTYQLTYLTSLGKNDVSTFGGIKQNHLIVKKILSTNIFYLIIYLISVPEYFENQKIYQYLTYTNQINPDKCVKNIIVSCHSI